jgi:23S rRNA (uridine2552-2'-O)-methyltransferase
MKKAYAQPDFWARKAAKEGYPARSVYKLRELDEKWRLVRGGARVLDLGAAPGSWSLYVLRMGAARTAGGTAGFLCACDLLPLSRAYDEGLFDDENRFFFLQGDFLLDENRRQIEERGPYNLVLSDAAPATSGNRTVDTMRSLALAETALSFAKNTLERGGNFVVKIFQGTDSGAFITSVRAVFDAVKTAKPAACRANSFEMYVIGLGRKKAEAL